MDSSAASGSSEFARNLGSRVDALESALNALAAGEHDAAGVVRELCESLALQARAAGFPRIHEQAQDLLTVESALLSRHGAGLVSLLRREATRHGTAQRMCLALNLTAATALALQDRVRSWGVQVHPLQTLRDLSALPGNTAPDAVIMARGEDPDHDMAMLAAVRARRHGADVPVLAIGEGPLPVASSNRLTVMQGVQFVQGPPDPSFIAGWIVECLMHLDTHAGEPLLDRDTGLLQRGAFLAAFQQLVERHDMAVEPVALAVMGLDRNGEAPVPVSEGDRRQAMMIIGRLLRGRLRNSDLVGRLDSAEFAALFPGVDESGGIAAVRKLARAFDGSTRPVEGCPPALRLCGGVIRLHPGQTVSEALEEADRNLYQARHSAQEAVHCTNPAGSVARKQVLLVMVPGRTRQVLHRALAAEPLDVTVLDTYAQAVAVLDQRLGVHLAVIDEALEGGMGAELVSRVRGIPTCSRTGLLVLGEGDSHQRMVAAFERGANAYVTRPISLETLLRQARRLLTRGRLLAAGDARVRRVLVVDEDTRSLFLMASALATRGGFQVLLAANPADLAGRLKDVDPDALVLALRAQEVMNPSAHIAPLIAAGRRYPSVVVLDHGREVCEARLSAQLSLKGVLQQPLDARHFAEQVEECLGLSPGPSTAPVLDPSFCRELQRIAALSHGEDPGGPPEADGPPKAVKWLG